MKHQCRKTRKISYCASWCGQSIIASVFLLDNADATSIESNEIFDVKWICGKGYAVNNWAKEAKLTIHLNTNVRVISPSLHGVMEPIGVR